MFCFFHFVPFFFFHLFYVIYCFSCKTTYVIRENGLGVPLCEVILSPVSHRRFFICVCRVVELFFMLEIIIVIIFV